MLLYLSFTIYISSFATDSCRSRSRICFMTVSNCSCSALIYCSWRPQSRTSLWSAMDEVKIIAISCPPRQTRTPRVPRTAASAIAGPPWAPGRGYALPRRAPWSNLLRSPPSSGPPTRVPAPRGTAVRGVWYWKAAAALVSVVRLLATARQRRWWEPTSCASEGTLLTEPLIVPIATGGSGSVAQATTQCTGTATHTDASAGPRWAEKRRASHSSGAAWWAALCGAAVPRPAVPPQMVSTAAGATIAATRTGWTRFYLVALEVLSRAAPERRSRTSPCARCLTDRAALVSVFAAGVVEYRRLRHARKTRKSRSAVAPEIRCFATRRHRGTAGRISTIC